MSCLRNPSAQGQTCTSLGAAQWTWFCLRKVVFQSNSISTVCAQLYLGVQTLVQLSKRLKPAMRTVPGSCTHAWSLGTAHSLSYSALVRNRRKTGCYGKMKWRLWELKNRRILFSDGVSRRHLLAHLTFWILPQTCWYRSSFKLTTQRYKGLHRIGWCYAPHRKW